MSDGWGTPDVTYTSASVYVQAWKFSPSDILFSRTDTRGSGISVSPTIPLPGPFDIDSHIFLVQVNLQTIILINIIGVGSKLKVEGLNLQKGI